MLRFPAREVMIGNRPVGGFNPIRVQSMTNTPPHDVVATVDQAIRIFEAGADYVRISTPNRESISRLEKIRKELKLAGFDQPLVADIHFNPELALMAARIVEKVRINPGNYVRPARKGQTEWTDREYADELEKVREDLAPLLSVCREYGTAIRIGTNAGSLSPRVVSRLGNTPEALVQSTIEFLKIFEDLGFYQTVVSLKASNPVIMIRSYLLMAGRMLREGMCYPLHVGVTEAGEGRSGRVKSALGICTLLNAGIGDTIRVSLSEPPEDEIPVAIKMAAPFQEPFMLKPTSGIGYKVPAFEFNTEQAPNLPGGHKAIVIANPDPLIEKNENSSVLVFDSADQNDKKAYPLFFENQTRKDDPLLQADFNFLVLNKQPAPDLANLTGKLKNPVLIIDCKAGDLQGFDENLRKVEEASGVKTAIIARLPQLGNDEDSVLIHLCTSLGKPLLERRLHGIWAEAPMLPSRQTILDLSFELLQATGLRITQTEFISCPTCARTCFDLQEVLIQVKEKTANLPGIKIAVMGCVVNGPGEMADADFGIIGAGPGKVHIYKGLQPVMRNIDQNQAADLILTLIKGL